MHLSVYNQEVILLVIINSNINVCFIKWNVTGTMPDANEIVARARKSDTTSFGNAILQVTVEFDLEDPPLFGAKYNFQLDGVVNCPEFLVHFPTFVKLAKKYGLKLVKKEKFSKFFERMKDEGKLDIDGFLVSILNFILNYHD